MRARGRLGPASQGATPVPGDAAHGGGREPRRFIRMAPQSVLLDRQPAGDRTHRVTYDKVGSRRPRRTEWRACIREASVGRHRSGSPSRPRRRGLLPPSGSMLGCQGRWLACHGISNSIGSISRGWVPAAVTAIAYGCGRKPSRRGHYCGSIGQAGTTTGEPAPVPRQRRQEPDIASPVVKGCARARQACNQHGRRVTKARQPPPAP